MRILKKLPIHPSFYLFFAWFVISGQVSEFFIFFFVILIHELGHYGVALNYKEGKFLPKDEVKIALAGPCANIVISLFLISLWWLYPSIYALTYKMVELGTFLAIINLLPAYPLDGGRVLVALLSQKMPRKKSLKISIIFNIAFSIIFFVAFIITCFINFNPTLALMVVFLVIGILESNFEGKYEKMSLFNKKIKNFSQIKSIYVSPSTKLSEIIKSIDANRLTIFYVTMPDGNIKTLSENAIMKLCLKYPYETKIEEIFAKN